MNVDIDPEEVKTAKTDSRGRLYLSSDYADGEVEVAILDFEEEDDNS